MSSTERMKQAEHCGFSSKPDVEPDRRVERRDLVQQDVRQLGLERVAVLDRREVAALAAPVGDRAGDARDHLLDRALARRASRAGRGSTSGRRCSSRSATTSSGTRRRAARRPTPIRASRSSHSTVSNGCTPGCVNRRRTLSASPARGLGPDSGLRGLLLHERDAPSKCVRLARREHGEAGVRVDECPPRAGRNAARPARAPARFTSRRGSSRRNRPRCRRARNVASRHARRGAASRDSAQPKRPAAANRSASRASSAEQPGQHEQRQRQVVVGVRVDGRGRRGRAGRLRRRRRGGRGRRRRRHRRHLGIERLTSSALGGGGFAAAARPAAG